MIQNWTAWQMFIWKVMSVENWHALLHFRMNEIFKQDLNHAQSLKRFTLNVLIIFICRGEKLLHQEIASIVLNYFATMSPNNDNTETWQDVLPDPPIVEPPENNNHYDTNPPDGNPFDENIPLIESPDNREGGYLTHKNGKSSLPSISGNFESNNNSHKYQHRKFLTFSDL